MTRAKSNYAATLEDRQSTGEILILPDGRILAHNITPALAQILATLDPADEAMSRRAGLVQSHANGATTKGPVAVAALEPRRKRGRT